MDGTNSNAMAIKPIKAPIPEYFAFKGYFFFQTRKKTKPAGGIK